MSISENISKKRGRPRVFKSGIFDSLIGFLGLEHKTGRTQADAKYRQWALIYLANDKTRTYPWIADIPKMEAGRHGMRGTILTHLGRLMVKEDILEAAAHINDNQLTTRDAIRYIREFRGLEPKGKPNCLELADKLLAVLHEYWKTFPYLEDRFFINALENAKWVLTTDDDGNPLEQEEE